MLTTDFQLEMEEVAVVLANLINFVYNLAWLVFLTLKHYGQVTTTAGHIFELNLLFQNTINIFLWTLLVDLGALDDHCIIRDMLEGVFLLQSWVALVGSQIETAIFLKTLDVNTMMTNTAGKIILAMTVFTVAMGLILTFAVPDRTMCEIKKELCAYLEPTDFYRTTIPSTIVLMIIFLVLGFTVFRSHQIERKRGIEHPENVGVQGTGETVVQGTGHEIEERSGDAAQGELFTIQRAISEIHKESEEDQENHAGNVEDDIVFEDIELVRIETPPQIFSDQVSIEVMIHEISEADRDNIWNDQTESEQIQCFPGMDMMIQTLNKYFKNTLMSLLILSSELPVNLTIMYGLITNSGCENPTFMLMSEISHYSVFIFDISLPFLIKLKLDRLSQ